MAEAATLEGKPRRRWRARTMVTRCRRRPSADPLGCAVDWLKRDANLQMHMRRHSDKYKSVPMLTKPPAAVNITKGSRHGNWDRCREPMQNPPPRRLVGLGGLLLGLLGLLAEEAASLVLALGGLVPRRLRRAGGLVLRRMCRHTAADFLRRAHLRQLTAFLRRRRRRRRGGRPSCSRVVAAAASSPVADRRSPVSRLPHRSPPHTRRSPCSVRERKRREVERGGEEEAEMWDLRGPHAESAATSDKTRVKTVKDVVYTGFGFIS
uniref:Uncharacterized protein n=1 Tax=Oryza nivara TaxID=4536 RepID=A0A0E0FF43_ORYNI